MSITIPFRMFVIIQFAARGVQARKAMASPIPGQLFHGVKDGVHWEFKWGLGPTEQPRSARQTAMPDGPT